jgi:hypothetical protein
MLPMIIAMPYKKFLFAHRSAGKYQKGFVEGERKSTQTNKY